MATLTGMMAVEFLAKANLWHCFFIRPINETAMKNNLWLSMKICR